MKKTVIVAKVFVINDQHQILALRRSPSDNHRPLGWDIPGGGVDYGEDPTTGVIREALEEAGLKIVNPRIISVSSKYLTEYRIHLLFVVNYSNEPIKLSSEHDQYQWVSHEDFMNLDIPIHYKEASENLKF
jgi:8-oxo-dGTP diphosphatase